MRFFNYLIIFQLLFYSIVSAYATTANPTDDAWTQVGETVRNGATSVYNGAKNVGGKAYTAVATISPSPNDVGKAIARTGAAAVGVEVINQLLNATDWIMDPANNSVIFKKPDASCSDNCYAPKLWSMSGEYYLSGDQACSAFKQNHREFSRSEFSVSFRQVTQNDGQCLVSGGYLGNNKAVGTTLRLVVNPSYDESKTDRVSLDTLGSRLIDSANRGDSRASAYVASVADAIATDQALEEQWEKTKAPATTADASSDPKADNKVSEGAATNTGSVAGQGTAESEAVKPTALEFPTFCSWASNVCDFIDWARAEPVTQDQNTKLDIQNESEKATNTNFSFASVCPASKFVPYKIAGATGQFEFSFSWLCDVCRIIKPVVITVSSFLAVLIVSGVRTEN